MTDMREPIEKVVNDALKDAATQHVKAELQAALTTTANAARTRLKGPLFWLAVIAALVLAGVAVSVVLKLSRLLLLVGVVGAAGFLAFAWLKPKFDRVLSARTQKRLEQQARDAEENARTQAEAAAAQKAKALDDALAELKKRNTP